MNEEWVARSKDRIYGTLCYKEIDQPWFFCEFEAAKFFMEIESLINEELRLMETDTANG